MWSVRVGVKVYARMFTSITGGTAQALSCYTTPCTKTQFSKTFTHMHTTHMHTHTHRRWHGSGSVMLYNPCTKTQFSITFTRMHTHAHRRWHGSGTVILFSPLHQDVVFQIIYTHAHTEDVTAQALSCYSTPYTKMQYSKHSHTCAHTHNIVRPVHKHTPWHAPSNPALVCLRNR